MADAIYNKAKEKFLSGAIDLTTDTIKVILVDTADYTFSSTHEFQSDVAAAAQEEISPAMTTKSVTDGTFDADDVTFSGTSGDACEAVIIFKDTGTDTTSPVIAYLDSLSGLPVTLGGDVTISWDAAGIFTI